MIFGNNSNTCALRRTQAYKDGRMNKENTTPARPGSPDYYRERARTMLKLAEDAASEEARASLIMLAASWEELATQIEHPNW